MLMIFLLSKCCVLYPKLQTFPLEKSFCSFCNKRLVEYQKLAFCQVICTCSTGWLWSLRISPHVIKTHLTIGTWGRLARGRSEINVQG